MAYPLQSDDKSLSGKRAQIRSTTVLAVRRDGRVVIAGDGQVTMGETIMKSGARKVRRLYNDKMLAGFAGATADAFALFQRFEGEARTVSRPVEPRGGRAHQGLAHGQDDAQPGGAAGRCGRQSTLVISGNGDVIAPDDGIVAIGSGGPTRWPRRARLARHTDFSAREIAEEAMKIAGEICIYSNLNIVIEEI